jgi:hypothetical protein
MSQPNAIYQDDFTLKQKLQYSMLGLVLIGGSFFIGRHLVRKAIANSEEKKTYEDGNSATHAKQIKMALENDGWWGTDEEALRNVIRAIPTKDEFKKVIASYQKLYNTALLKDMKEELQTNEYNEMLFIIAAKPDRIINGQPNIGPLQYRNWARRLNAAFNLSYGWIRGTDEDAIKAVFTEIPTQDAFQKVAEAYLKEYGNNLVSELKSELEFWEIGDMMDIINKKPKA